MAEIDLSLWRTRIDQAVGYHARQHPRWYEAQKMAQGDWMSQYQALTDPDYTPVNYAKAYLSAVVASIYARNPYFFCKARHSRWIHFARSMELVLNYFKDELRLKTQVKRMITDALITGQGWMEVGYTATFGQLDLKPQDDSGLFARLLKKIQRPAEQGVLNEYVKEISPYAVRLSPWNVYRAPGYHAVAEMPYLVVGEDLAPEELQVHPLYQRLFANSSVVPSRRIETTVAPVSTPGMARFMGHAGSSGKLDAMYRMWHVWDRRANQRFLWLDGTQDTAGPFPWNLAIEGFPQVELRFTDLPETNKDANAYPIGDLTFLMPQLKELNRLRTQMVRHRKRSGGTIITQESAMTDEQAHRFQNSSDLELIRMKGNPKELHSFTPAALSDDVYKVGAQIMADIDLIGQLPFLLSSAISPNQTATRDTLMAQGGATTRVEKVDVIEEVLMEVGKRLAAVIWEYAPRSLIAEVLGEDELPEDLWPTPPEDAEARRDMIERELGYSLEAGSTQPLKDKTLKNEQKIKFINILGGIAPERIKITDKGLGSLADDFDMPELREWMILDDDLEQQAIQQENQLLAQNMPQVVGPYENHQLHEQGHAQLVMGPQSTDAAEQHLLAHRQARMAKQPGHPAQAGDGGATRGTAAKPEAQRQGIGGIEDILSVVGRSQTQPGEQRGGPPNV